MLTCIIKSQSTLISDHCSQVSLSSRCFAISHVFLWRYRTPSIQARSVKSRGILLLCLVFTMRLLYGVGPMDRRIGQFRYSQNFTHAMRLSWRNVRYPYSDAQSNFFCQPSPSNLTQSCVVLSYVRHTWHILLYMCYLENVGHRCPLLSFSHWLGD